MSKNTPAADSVRWKDEPDEHDYPAAASYLSLVAGDDVVQATVAALQQAPVTRHKAKDVLRASRLPLLTEQNEHVARDLHKIAEGKDLSPVLLVRGDLTRDLPLHIADGYHRVCASHHVDENVDVPARIVDAPRP